VHGERSNRLLTWAEPARRRGRTRVPTPADPGDSRDERSVCGRRSPSIRAGGFGRAVWITGRSSPR